MKLARYGLLLVMLSLGGCAFPPSTAQMKHMAANVVLPHLPKDNEAVVYIVRPGILGLLLHLNVYLDGRGQENKMGFTTGHSYVYFYVKPGDHQIYSKAKNWKRITIHAKPGSAVFIRQRIGPGFFVAREYLSMLHDYEGTYYLRHLAKGHIFKTHQGKGTEH